MTKERKEEIAYALLKYRMCWEDIRLVPDLQRELGDLTEEIEVSSRELKEFMGNLLKEVLEESLG